MGLLGNLPNDQVLRAEILRNLGRFREAISLLEDKAFSQKLGLYAAAILDASKSGSARPFVVMQND